MDKYGYVYLTENKVNNMKYIGQHHSSSFDNSYLGSGILLERSIKKYGKSNFKCSILQWCYSKKELDDAEIKWISEYDATQSAEFYNIHAGGSGGNTLSGLSKEQKLNFSSKVRNSLIKKYEDPKERERCKALWTPFLRKQVSDKKKEQYKDPKFVDKVKNTNCFYRKGIDPWNKGRTNVYSEEQLSKMRGNPSGKKGKGILGKIAIYKGTTTKYIYESDLDSYLAQGFSRGRCYKSKSGVIIGGDSCDRT